MPKKIFYSVIVLSLIFNFLSDFGVYQISLEENKAGEWVSHSYQVLQAIDAAKLDLFEARLKKKSTSDLNETFKNISILVSDIPSQKLRALNLAKISEKQLLEKNYNQALQIIGEMTATEKALLEDRLDRDRATNSEGMRRTILANSIDIFLILIAFAFFVYERKLSLRMQKALTSSLIHVESVNQRLQQSLFQKDSKFRIAVHDLKNPLGSIRGFAELLQDEAGNNKSMLEMTQVIQRISNSTLGLVNSVLKNESDELSLKEDVNVLTCLKETCNFLEPMARNKKQRIQFKNESCEFIFWGSRQKIQDVFYNVIGNALKFAPFDSVVTVNCIDEGNSHAIQIKDQGPGFAKEDFSKMFLHGSKLSAKPSAGEDSTGIGLYSAKQTVESFHGTIDVTNNSDLGACVTIRFPSKPDSVNIS